MRGEATRGEAMRGKAMRGKAMRGKAMRYTDWTTWQDMAREWREGANVARTVLLPRLRQRHLGRASRQRRGWPLSLALLGSVRRGSIGPRAAGGAGGCEHPSDDVGVELMALSGEVVVGARELLDPVARHVHIWLVARQHDRILRIVGVCPVAKVVE